MDDRIVAGVAAGIADRIGVDTAFVRAAFVVLALAGGTGVVLYVLAYLVAEPVPIAGLPRPRSTSSRTGGFLLIVLGALLLLRDLGLWFGNALVWPVALAAVGSAVIWTRSDDRERTRLRGLAGRIPGDPLRTLFAPGRATLLRVGLGGLLVIVGLTSLLTVSLAVEEARDVLIGVAGTVAGVALVLGPWISRLATQVSAERSERIRSEERAVVAAHLHDSVLQTLALIQRSADVREMATLARAQERELRTWLYGPRSDPEHQLLSAALEELAGLVEQRYHVKVEVVVVGDGPMDGGTRALVSAIGEALHNAARHSEAPTVSVYVECTPQGCSAYVTDEGRGFDPHDVPTDRRGITDSIVGRMERHGGTATITSDPGEGTEVHLYLPGNAT